MCTRAKGSRFVLKRPDGIDHLRILHREYLDQPFEVSLETLALCNAACTFCPYPTLERKGQKMPTELIHRLIDEMTGFEKTFSFSPFKVNEPLLDKRIYDICERFSQCEHGRIRLFTNGSPLTHKTIERIAGLEKIDHLWISLNSVDPEHYKALMGLDYEKTARNLDALHKQDFPHEVVVSSVGAGNRWFVDYCRNRWPKFRPQLIPNTGWLGYTEEDYDEVPDESCSRWWELSIMASGVVSLCCMDSDGSYAIGDVNEQTLLEVYNSQGERREELLSRKQINPCQRCTY